MRVGNGQLWFRLRNQAAVPVTAWGVAAEYLLADGTSQRIAFAHRRQDLAVWQRIRAAFETARRAGTWERVERAIEELDRPDEAGSRHHIVTAARRDLQRLIEQPQQRSLGAILCDWMRRADAHVAAATRHSRRR